MLTHIEVKGRKYLKLFSMQEGILTYGMTVGNQRFEMNVFLSKNNSGFYVLDNYEINNFIINKDGTERRGDFVAGAVLCSFDELKDYLMNNDIVSGE